MAKAQIEGGDVPALDFEFQIGRILCGMDITKYRAVEFICSVENIKNKSSSITRAFYYFTSDTIVESLQIDNYGENECRIIKSSFRIIKPLFFPISGSSSVDSILETKIKGAKAYLVYGHENYQLQQPDTLICNKDFILRMQRENGILRDSSIYYSNGTHINNGILDMGKIECYSDKMIDRQTRRTAILSIDSSKAIGNKLLLTERSTLIDEELTCPTQNKSIIITQCTWQCELNRNNLIEKMEIVKEEGKRLLYNANEYKLTMAINYSNERQKEFCKYLTPLKIE